MDNMFGGLEELGFGQFDNINVFAEPEKEEESASELAKKEKVEKVIDESEFIFDKTMSCPVCGKQFKTKQVRTGKPRFVGTDTDLRPIYANIDTVKYDAVVCLHCGYSSLMRIFNSVSPRQIKEVRENISKDFKGITNELGAYSYPVAIQRYKLALYNEVVKHSKLSERAFICLRIAWLYRGWAEEMIKTSEGNEKDLKECAIGELMFTKNAYDGFVKAIAKEMPPICNMDETTLNCLMAELGRKCQDYDNAEKFAFAVISSRSASIKAKDKTREILERIKEEKANFEKMKVN